MNWLKAILPLLALANMILVHWYENQPEKRRKEIEDLYGGDDLQAIAVKLRESRERLRGVLAERKSE